MKNNKNGITLLIVFIFIFFIIGSLAFDFISEINGEFSLILFIPFIVFIVIFIFLMIKPSKNKSDNSGEEKKSNIIYSEFDHESNHEDHTIIGKINTVKCPKCFKDNNDDRTFCIYCGAKLEKECPYCYCKFPAIKKFCPNCNKRVKEEKS